MESPGVAGLRRWREVSPGERSLLSMALTHSPSLFPPRDILNNLKQRSDGSRPPQGKTMQQTNGKDGGGVSAETRCKGLEELRWNALGFELFVSFL